MFLQYLVATNSPIDIDLDSYSVDDLATLLCAFYIDVKRMETNIKNIKNNEILSSQTLQEFISVL